MPTEYQRALEVVLAVLVVGVVVLTVVCVRLWRLREKDLSAHVAYAIQQDALPCPRCTATAALTPDDFPEPWRLELDDREVYMEFADIVWAHREREVQFHPDPPVSPGRDQ